jgi:hypothetical protein
MDLDNAPAKSATRSMALPIGLLLASVYLLCYFISPKIDAAVRAAGPAPVWLLAVASFTHSVIDYGPAVACVWCVFLLLRAWRAR